MAKKPGTSLAGQVEKVCADRIYLRSGISTLVSIAGDRPDVISPAIIKQLQEMLDYTANPGEGA